MKRFQIITTDAGSHGVAVGGNGETVWTTEVHPDVRDTENAVSFLADLFLGDIEREAEAVWTTGWVTFSYDGDSFGEKLAVPVERIDKRSVR